MLSERLLSLANPELRDYSGRDVPDSPRFRVFKDMFWIDRVSASVTVQNTHE